MLPGLLLVLLASLVEGDVLDELDELDVLDSVLRSGCGARAPSIGAEGAWASSAGAPPVGPLVGPLVVSLVGAV